jgi:hypothetical protein
MEVILPAKFRSEWLAKALQSRQLGRGIFEPRLCPISGDDPLGVVGRPGGDAGDDLVEGVDLRREQLPSRSYSHCTLSRTSCVLDSFKPLEELIIPSNEVGVVSIGRARTTCVG